MTSISLVPAAYPAGALEALPEGVSQPAGTRETIERDGQVRLWWDETPVDLFFDYLAIHAEAARHVRTVPFAQTKIPILGSIELATFKAMFDRTRDWADIEAMVVAKSFDVDAVRASLSEMLGPDDPRIQRLDEAVSRGAATELD